MTHGIDVVFIIYYRSAAQKVTSPVWRHHHHHHLVEYQRFCCCWWCWHSWLQLSTAVSSSAHFKRPPRRADTMLSIDKLHGLSSNKNESNLARGGIARLYSPGGRMGLTVWLCAGWGFIGPQISPSPGGSGTPSHTMCHRTPEVYPANVISVRWTV